ncbi:MAG: hypothetical protein MUF58_22340 [Arcicella sp.]|nr:hypothetical protein [Arcicella sp.]
MYNIKFFAVVIFSGLFSLTACKKEEVVVKEPVKAETVRDLAADPTTTSSTGQPVSAGKYTFSDSATTKWDLAFRGTTILTNGGSSGIGQGGASILNGIFDEIKTIPATATFTLMPQPILFRLLQEKFY